MPAWLPTVEHARRVRDHAISSYDEAVRLDALYKSRVLSSFLDLPKCVLVDLILTWLRLKDVCRLDAAVSDRAFRDEWLRYLRDLPFYGSTDQDDLFSKAALNWLWVRYVSVSHMVCDPAVLLQGHQGLPVRPNTWVSLCLKNGLLSTFQNSYALINVLRDCSNLQTFRVVNVLLIGWPIVTTIAKYLPRLLFLHLVDQFVVPDVALAYWMDDMKHLVEITMTCCTVNTDANPSHLVVGLCASDPTCLMQPTLDGRRLSGVLCRLPTDAQDWSSWGAVKSQVASGELVVITKKRHMTPRL
jgi:hypothetical protein